MRHCKEAISLTKRQEKCEGANGDDDRQQTSATQSHWAKIGATVRFMQPASFAQQREEMLPGDALALKREREATRARLRPTEALSGAERDHWHGQAPSAFAAAAATLEVDTSADKRPSLAGAGKKVITGIRFQTSAESAFGIVVQEDNSRESEVAEEAWEPDGALPS